MSDKLLSRERYGEAFWRAKFKAEPQPPSPKLLYRRRNLSHTLGHSLSHRLSHMTYGSPGVRSHCAAGTRGPSAEVPRIYFATLSGAIVMVRP
jgi:hypothetical protein